jgi:hypothetical protein
MYKGGGDANRTCQLGVAVTDAAGGTQAVLTSTGDSW